MKYLVGAAALFLLMAAVALGVVLTGGYDVAATTPHTAPVAWALDTTMENSVERQAEDIVAPAAFTPEQIREGFGDYDGMCVQCHGAPGVEQAEWAVGLYPSPPALSEAASHWEPGEVFWILRHGIRMSGMPALGPTHDDEALWAITAFAEQLPEMSAEEYAALREEVGGAGHHGEGGEGGSGEHGGSDDTSDAGN